MKHLQVAASFIIDLLLIIIDLKTSNQIAWSNVFWYVKKYMYSESLFNTLCIEIKRNY